MKKRLLYFLLMIFPFSGMAQSFHTSKLNFTESQTEYKDTQRARAIDAMHSTNRNIATVRFARKHLVWDVFDVDMNREYTKTIKKFRDEEYLGHVNTGNIMQVFTAYEEKFSMRIIFCYTFNIKEYTHTKTQLFKSDYLNNEARPNPLITDRNILFAASPNNKYVAIAIDDYGNDRDSFTIRVFDTKQLELVYSTFYRNEKEKRFLVDDFIINNDAEVYNLGKIFDFKRYAFVGDSVNFKLVLHKISKEKQEQLDIPLEDVVQSLRIQEKDSELRLVGYYSGVSFQNVRGISYFTVDKNEMSLVAQKKSFLPKQIYYDLYRKKAADRLEKESWSLTDFIFKDMFTDSKGNTYYLIQESITSVACEMDIRDVNPTTGALEWHTVPRNEAYFDLFADIIIFKINPEGDVLWGRALDIRSDPETPKAFVKDDALHIVLNADCSVRERADGRIYMKHKMFNKTCLFDMVFSETGEIQMHSFPYRETFDSFYEPNHGFFADGKYVIPENFMKNKRFIKFY